MQWTVPLPTASFQVDPHPTLDVVPVLHFAGTFRKLTLNRQTGSGTVGPSIAAPVIDATAFNANTTRLYYKDISNFSSAGICRFDLNASGDPIGQPACDRNPPRDIDNDIQNLTFPCMTCSEVKVPSDVGDRCRGIGPRSAGANMLLHVLSLDP